MKKIILFLVVLAIVPISMFAEGETSNSPLLEVDLGPAAFYKSPVLLGQPIDLSNANCEQFAFGADLRVKFGVFQAEAVTLYSSGAVHSLNTYFDVGIAADIAILRLSLGAGPNFIFNLENNTPFQAGLNAKAGIDLNVGPVVFGVSYIMALNIANVTTVSTGSGLLGASVLFKL